LYCFGLLLKRKTTAWATLPQSYVSWFLPPESWRPACHEELSAIAGLYEKWNKHDAEVVFVSLDEDNEAFRNYAGGFPFISICDYQKWESPVVKAYHVFATPTMYLLDSKREVLLPALQDREFTRQKESNNQINQS